MAGPAADAFEWAAALTHEATAGRVLDVGCGEGRFLPPGGVGLDLDAARLARARDRSALIVRADAHALPFRDATFDTVYAHRVLNDAGRVDHVLGEIARVLRTQGRLLLFTRARHGDGDRLDRWNGEARLRDRFEHVAAELHPTDERAAFFRAERPRVTAGATASGPR